MPAPGKKTSPGDPAAPATPGIPGIPGIFFTAFEPSGDALAAAMIAAIKAARPDVPVYALGGPLMEQAGASLIENTTEHAVMLTGVVSQIRVHQKRLGAIKHWLKEHALAAHVPVDSAAANWSICKLVRQTQPDAKIVHLVLPQVWAWARWRIHKLRRLTDHVLCILPFEPAFLREHDVPGSFVGHPLYDTQTGAKQRVSDGAGQLPSHDGIKLGILPGSRLSVIKANLPTMLDAFLQLHESSNLAGCIAAANDRDRQVIERIVHDRAGPLSKRRLTIATGQVDDVLHWADVALTNSGTATLHVAAHACPMLVMYNVSRWSWHLAGRWLVKTRCFALPNIIVQDDARSHVVPELVPHFGNVKAVAQELKKLVDDPAARTEQREALERMGDLFADRPFGETAAKHLFDVLDA